jgi:malonate-semialdehyde dehydrogenase (acetylating)/methylmalonate-semialdehyde dehydrogenase
MGPVVTKQHQEKVLGYIDQGVKEGADLVVDGRGFSLQGYENGYFVGGTLFDRVTTDMTIYKEEIFGPVLSVVRPIPTTTPSIKMINDHEYGNGTAIFTRDGDAARAFADPSRSAWSASTCRSRCRSPIIPSAAGSGRCSAIIRSTVRKACASTRG